jgi:hypothetical protein
VKQLTLLTLLKLKFPFCREEQLRLHFQAPLGYYALMTAEIDDNLG